MYTNYTEEQVFFTAKIFTLQEVTLTLQDNADEMPAHFNVTQLHRHAMKKCE
jgi:hypothetical protein